MRWRRRDIIREFGQWAVDARGIANLWGPVSYEIGEETLGAPWWASHMAAKRWVVLADFKAALSFARRHFGFETPDAEPLRDASNMQGDQNG